MLSYLRVKNLALVENLVWQPTLGLICVSGETGAGKSLLLSAARLALGRRAERNLIRSGSSEAHVHAVFKLSTNTLQKINATLTQLGLPECEDYKLICSRTINASSGKQFINSCPCPLSSLRAIADKLVDFHDAQERNTLASCERQIMLLDAFANNENNISNYHRIYQKWLDAKKRLQEFQKNSLLSPAEAENYQFQLAEIDELNPSEALELKLYAKHKRLSSQQNILETNAKLLQNLEIEDDNIFAKIQICHKHSQEIERLDPQAAKLNKEIVAAKNHIQNAIDFCQNYAQEIISDADEVSTIENKINQLELLKRKHGGTINDILNRAQKMRQSLSDWQSREETLSKLNKTLEQLQKKLSEKAQIIRAKRNKKANVLAINIKKHLQELGLENAEITIEINPAEKFLPNGKDIARFLFNSNPGEKLKDLNLVASSGEMSRLLLAAKSALAEKDDMPLLVFDELDAHVGGLVAKAVGKKMARLAHDRQVIAITHLPQVAAQAKAHYLVDKKIKLVNNSQKSYVFIQEVHGEKRLAEIMRMLGGKGEAEKRLAKSLLAQNA